MHELSVCLALLDEVGRVASVAAATSVQSVTVRIGPLSGIEAGPLRRAFEVARSGGVAHGAELIVDVARVRIRCGECATESEAAPNRLLCPTCGSYRTRVIEGDELVLSAVEMDVSDDDGPTAGGGTRAEPTEHRRSV